MQVIIKGHLCFIDKEDLSIIKKYRWVYDKKDERFKATYYGNGKKKTLQMSRVILNVNDKKLEVDHINRIGIDNRKINLRICTRNENSRNRTAWGGSKYLGVYHKIYKIYLKRKKQNIIRDNGWVAQINHDKKRYTKKGFKTENEAALAYNEMARELHGKFANLNIII